MTALPRTNPAQSERRSKPPKSKRPQAKIHLTPLALKPSNHDKTPKSYHQAPPIKNQADSDPQIPNLYRKSSLLLQLALHQRYDTFKVGPFLKPKSLTLHQLPSSEKQWSA